MVKGHTKLRRKNQEDYFLFKEAGADRYLLNMSSMSGFI